MPPSVRQTNGDMSGVLIFPTSIYGVVADFKILQNIAKNTLTEFVKDIFDKVIIHIF